MSESLVRIRLLFADQGAYHHEDVAIPAGALERHERIIDCLREDPAVLKRLHVDLERLCSASVMDED